MATPTLIADALAGWAAAARAAEQPLPEKFPCAACGIDRIVNAKSGTIRKHKAAKGDVLPCPGSGAPVLSARVPTRARGYYKDPKTGDRYPSVTTLLDKGMAKAALSFWSAKVVAEAAMDNLPAMLAASRTPEEREEFIKWLKNEPIRRRDDRGDIGRAVHRLIEARILGEPPPAQLASNPEFTPYIDHFHDAVRTWKLRFRASEMVVANPGENYGGTLDYIVTSPLLTEALNLPPRSLIMGDTKTGGELDQVVYSGHKHGVYPQAGAQMAAYRAAPVGWLRDGTRIDMPECAPIAVVLHLRPEGWRLYPARCGDDMFQVFKGAQFMADFETYRSKNVIGEALTPPTPTSDTGDATTGREDVA
ncbi:hypothetical protein AB0J43_02690 [Nonomuraea fuscirosea]